VKREIISIDRERCTGCGQCVPDCPEGALQLIDGKARLISDLFCDGLGACIGGCPEDAISVEVREAEPYDEARVMENITAQGENVIRAHLEHLREHGEQELLGQAMEVLRAKGIDVRLEEPRKAFRRWPIQMHLLPAMAPHLHGADVLLCADCAAYAMSDFHSVLLRERIPAIACPKLDHGQDIYLDKLIALVDNAEIRSLTVAVMEVPCCRGLLELARRAVARARRTAPLSVVTVGIDGRVLGEQIIDAGA